MKYIDVLFAVCSCISLISVDVVGMAEPPTLENIDPAVLQKICIYLRVRDIARLAQVSHQMRAQTRFLFPQIEFVRERSNWVVRPEVKPAPDSFATFGWH